MTEALSNYLYCAAGIAISVLLPVLSQWLPKPKAEVAGGTGAGRRLWKIAKPYLITVIFSLVAAALVVAFLGEELTDWRAALLAGYAADSTLQKIRGGK